MTNRVVGSIQEEWTRVRFSKCSSEEVVAQQDFKVEASREMYSSTLRWDDDETKQKK